MSNENLGKQWIVEIIGDVKKRRDNMQKHLSRLKNEGNYKQAHVDALAVLNAMLAAAAPQVVANDKTLLRELLQEAEGLHSLNCGEFAVDASDWDDPEIFNRVRAALAAAPVQTQESVCQKISPMGEDGDQWYFDCDGHYIDVKKDANGKYSIFFRDRSNGAEAWLDQADLAPVQPVAVPDNWRDNLVGLHVSMDVSTGEENGGDRIFGEIEEVMDGGDALVLLAVESSRNFAAPAAQGDASQAAIDVLAERRRQIEQEGWKAADDDKHADGQMAVAAGYYAMACGYPHERDIGGGIVPQYWPWGRNWWKPKGKRANLVRAGALIVAEIERLDRAAIAAKAAS